MEAKTKEEQYIIPENIARDLKNEFGVDYSLSGMRNATHHINYTCKTMEPLHSNMQSIEDVLEWQHDMKKWFSCVKRDGFEMYVQDETMLLQDHVPKRGPWSPGGQKVFQILFRRSPETGDLRCNIGFAPVLSTGKKNSTARRFSNLSKNCWDEATKLPL